MKKGEINDAVRRALNILDAWNDVSWVIERGSSWYYEMQSVIEDAVHCGAQSATGDFKQLEGERDGNCPPITTVWPTDKKEGEA